MSHTAPSPRGGRSAPPWRPDPNQLRRPNALSRDSRPEHGQRHHRGADANAGARPHRFVDLVFYNRLLQCFVIIEIKTEKLTHQDIGQLQMYVNYYDRIEKNDNENPTIGILLCANKNDGVVKFSLPENNKNIIASQYKLYLPTEKQLLEEVKKELESFEEDKNQK